MRCGICKDFQVVSPDARQELLQAGMPATTSAVGVGIEPSPNCRRQITRGKETAHRDRTEETCLQDTKPSNLPIQVLLVGQFLTQLSRTIARPMVESGNSVTAWHQIRSSMIQWSGLSRSCWSCSRLLSPS
jgi:hypothetical protein